MVCEYNSLTRTKTTLWGEATSDEMCFAFIFVSPETPEFSFVLDYGNIDTCSSALTSYGGCPPMELGFVAGTRCHMTSFVQRERKLIVNDVKSNCSTNTGCTDQCVQPLKMYKEHPCINTTDLSIPRFIEDSHRLSNEEKKLLETMMDMCKSKLVPPPPASPSPAGSFANIFQPSLTAMFTVTVTLICLATL